MCAIVALFVPKKEVMAALGAMNRSTATTPYYIYV